jgi:lipoprotein-releasing system permease protein
MYRWFIAYKYIFSRLITFGALVVVASSVALLIIIVSVMEGFRSELQNRIRGTSSDLKVESTRYIDLKDPERVAAILAKVPGVRATAPYVETLTLYRAETGFLGPQDLDDRYLRVVDLEKELQVGDLADYVAAVGFARLPKDPRTLFSREWVESGLWKVVGTVPVYLEGQFPPPVLLGKEALRREFLRPGDVVSLTAYSPGTQRPKTRKFLVAGYFKTGLYELDSKGIIMERSTARDFLDLRTPDGRELASGVRIAVEPGLESEEGLAKVRADVEVALDRNEILFVRTLTWQEEKSSLLQAVKMEKALITIILGMIVLFSGFMIFIILTVQVVEKTRDLGVLQSMGATARGIASIYFTVGLSLCIAGTILGTIYGVGFALNVNTIQRWIKICTGLEVFPAQVYYLDKIPVRFQPADLIFIIVPTVLASLLASLVPAYRAARKDPVVALRYE